MPEDLPADSLADEADAEEVVDGDVATLLDRQRARIYRYGRQQNTNRTEAELTSIALLSRFILFAEQVDPRAGRLTSYADVDAMQDKKVELDFSSMSSLPPPKKKARISTEASEGAAATTPQEGSDAQSTAMEEAS